jgi:hypothetical protein
LTRIQPIIFILLFLYINCSGQVKPKSNLEIFEKTISNELERLFYYPGVDRSAPFIFVISSGDTRNNHNTEVIKFLTGLVKKTASGNNLNFSIAPDSGNIKTDSVYFLFLLKVNKLMTSYPEFVKNKFLGEKVMRRNITADIPLRIIRKESDFKINDTIKMNYTDEVDLENYKDLESYDYYFTQGRPPAVGIIEKTFFPALLIVVSAAATLLFFIIRTK